VSFQDLVVAAYLVKQAIKRQQRSLP